MEKILIPIIIVIAIVIYLVYEHYQLQVTHTVIQDPAFPGSLRAVVLADLHNTVFGKDNRRLLQKIAAIPTDCYLIPGDVIVDGDVGNEIGQAFVLELAKLGKPIYISLGNHEYRYRMTHPEEYDAMVLAYQKAGVYYLDNTYAEGPSGCRIYGISIPLSRYKKFCETPPYTVQDMKEVMDSPKEGYSILLGHNPVYFESFRKWGANLSIAGHMHGGLIRLPIIGALVSPQFRWFPKYDAGLFCEEEKYMFVSRGLGTHTINIRVHNRPEIAVLEINQS